MKTPISLLLAIAALALPTQAEDVPKIALEGAQKQEVRHSMIGPRDTLIFYTLADQKAVVRLHIGNKNMTFPVTGKIYLFDEKTTGEGLAKWINNQHSDGIFPEVPEPTKVFDLPEGICKVTEHKAVGEPQKMGPIQKTVFQDYKVKVTGEAHKEEGKYELAPFTTDAGVFVVVENS